MARSSDVEFYVWAEDADDVPGDHLALLEDPEAFPVRESVQGVTVYGNEQGWEWRTEAVHVFIERGPHGDSKLPNREELAPIVEASLEVSYPPETA